VVQRNYYENIISISSFTIIWIAIWKIWI